MIIRIPAFVLLIVLILPLSITATQLQKRTPFSIPLPSISSRTDKGDPSFKMVTVSKGDSREFVVIGRLNDKLVKHKRQDVKKLEYAEASMISQNLSRFEAQELGKVIQSLVQTLEIFERDLAKKRWDRCLYLDAYFPRFMKGFYHLSCAAFNSHSALPSEVNVPDNLFDVSQRSIKSDLRIFQWQKKKDHIIKLRIASKELGYQLKSFHSRQLATFSKKSEIFSYNEQLRSAFSLFVKLYFLRY